jgi:hypothetical protein
MDQAKLHEFYELARDQAGLPLPKSGKAASKKNTENL